MSLARRLLLIGIVVSLGPLGIVCTVVWWTGRQAQEAAARSTHDLADADLQHIVQLVEDTCELFIAERQQELDRDLSRARAIFDRGGAISLDPSRPVGWDARDQASGRIQQVSLPGMRIGGSIIEPVSDPRSRAVGSDAIREVTGTAATIFQRMNEAGDMLRVSTTVVGKDGRRAAGTYLKAVQPDGQANPVLASVLAGKRYVGRAFVVDTWFAAAYEPITDGRGRIIGMLFVGRPEGATMQSLLDKLAEVKVGKTGYVYVLQATGASAGSYVLSAGRQRDGQNILDAKDANGRAFIREIVDTAPKLGAGVFGDIRYPWKNASDTAPVEKVAIYRYFAPWDWVIAASVPTDEFLAAVREVEAHHQRANWTLFAVTLLATAGVALTWTLFARRLEAKLLPALAELRDGAEHVARAGSQVSSSADALARGASEQAASLEETSASMEEMASMTRSNAEVAGGAAEQMAGMERIVGDANVHLQAMVSSMRELRESSARVSKIIKTIDEIAFQTNILALNAAVEAARAGEAGLGFAIVADEVRNLAQRSAAAAKDTAALIEDSVGVTTAGDRKVQAVAESIGRLTERVAGIRTAIDSVRAASSQQATGITQVTTAVAEMERVTQTTAASAEEGAAASEDLQRSARESLVLLQALETQIKGVDARPAAPARVESGTPRARTADRAA